MVSLVKQKVTSEHLQRKAYLYVRQSSLKQVRRNQESGRAIRGHRLQTEKGFNKSLQKSEWAKPVLF